jgi:hypothetical protein
MQRSASQERVNLQHNIASVVIDDDDGVAILSQGGRCKSGLAT